MIIVIINIIIIIIILMIMITITMSEWDSILPSRSAWTVLIGIPQRAKRDIALKSHSQMPSSLCIDVVALQAIIIKEGSFLTSSTI